MRQRRLPRPRLVSIATTVFDENEAALEAAAAARLEAEAKARADADSTGRRFRCQARRIMRCLTETDTSG